MAASLPSPGASDVFYIIDLSGYVFRAYHAIAPLSTSRGEPTHAVLGTVNMLQRVVTGRKPARLAIAMDSKGPTFRSVIDPRYKAHRPPPPPDLGPQMERCREIVEAYRIPVFQGDGIEADDFIATAVAHARKSGLRTVVVSADKDLMQLVADDETEDADVVLWDSMRDRVFGPAEVREKFGVKPSQLRDLLALTGDTSDNVPGVPGVGPKTASDLLIQFGTLEAMYAQLDAVKRPKLRALLTEHRGEAELSQKLVTLREDCPMQWDLEALRYGGADSAALLKLFTELEFHRLREGIERSLAPKPAAPQAGAVSADIEVGIATAVASAAPPVALAGAADGAATATATSAAPVLATSVEDLQAVFAVAKRTGRLGLAMFASRPAVVGAALLGIAVCAEGVPVHYAPIGHRYLGAAGNLPEHDVLAALADAVAGGVQQLVGQDLKGSLILLGERGITTDASLRLFDVELAAYLLDPETPHTLLDIARRDLGTELPVFGFADAKGKVSGVDLESTEVALAPAFTGAWLGAAFALHAGLQARLDSDGLGPLARDIEMPLVRTLADVERAGILVDVAKLQLASASIGLELQALDARAQELAGRAFSLRSRDQLETILFDELKLRVVKKTPKGGRSTDAEVLQELAGDHPLPQVLCDYRELDKLKGTYLDALPRYVSPKTGRIHSQFRQMVAATGRLSSTDPNLQNIPIRTEAGRNIRAAFPAAPGHKLVSGDYSQIELRVLAHLSGDAALQKAFAGDEDVHRYTASLIFEVDSAAVTSEMRRQAKTINFGVLYGMGDSALAKQLGVSREVAAKFIAAYFQRYASVRAFLDDTVLRAKNGDAVRTMLGRRRFLPALHSPNRGLRMEAERIAKNTPIQGTAADILKIAMVALGNCPPSPGARMLLTVHDELVFEVPDAEVAVATAEILRVMGGAVSLSVPLVVTVGVGDNWRSAHG